MNSSSPRALLEARTATGSTRGGRTDGAHLALVMEGGGMRGIVSVAMASAFEDRGFLQAFDSVHGSSAGACGAAYFAAGQAASGARVYFEDINNKKFINVLRPLWGRAIMNKDFLIDDVMRNAKPLQTDKILAVPGFLNIIATEVATGRGQQFDTFRDAEHLFRILKASICLPLIAGRSVEIEGKDYVDGGIAQQIALESAIAKGATHVIVLMTRGEHEAERPEREGFQADASILRRFYGLPLYSAYRSRSRRINEVVLAVRNGEWRTPDGRSILIDSVSRSADCIAIGRLTTDGELLEAAFHEGRGTAFAYLDRAS